jgi:Clostripain family
MAKKKFLWTVMVYLAGDNNLTDESVFSLTEMKKVKTDDRIAVIAQLDPKAAHIPSHRYVINHARARQGPTGRAKLPPGAGTLGTDAIRIEEPTVKFRDLSGRTTRAQRAKPDDGETDTGDPATLFDFISWTQEHFSAERYMLILAGHGAGTEEDFLLRDDNPTNSLSMRELRTVFEKVKNTLGITIDILGMDVCLMSMVEVCFELNGLVEYLVSSESFSPTAGWPYGQILEKLKQEKNATTEELAKTIVSEYIGFYSDYVVGGLSVDQSVLRVSASGNVADAVKGLAAVIAGSLTEQPVKDALILAHWESQSYNGELFVDLRDFCELLAVRYPSAAPACEDVIKAIGALVRKSCFTGVDNQFSNGVSIYFPWSDVAPSYRDLSFAGRAGWYDFLQAYVEKTRRKPRGFKEGDELLLDFVAERPLKFASVALGGERFRKSDDRKSDDRGANPIHSMRNPPITVVKEGLSECSGANATALQSLQVLSNIRGRHRSG